MNLYLYVTVRTTCARLILLWLSTSLKKRLHCKQNFFRNDFTSRFVIDKTGSRELIFMRCLYSKLQLFALVKFSRISWNLPPNEQKFVYSIQSDFSSGCCDSAQILPKNYNSLYSWVRFGLDKHFISIFFFQIWKIYPVFGRTVNVWLRWSTFW